MHRWGRLAFSISAMLLAATVGAPAGPNCALREYASLDLGTDPNGGVYVTAIVNGHPEELLVDTAGVASMLTRTTITQLALNTEPLQDRYVVIENGGQTIDEMALADQVQLGTLSASHVHFLVIPDNRLTGDETGILAPDMLINYDVELDFAKGKLNLFFPEHCPEQVVYWTRHPYAQVSFQMNHDGHILIPAELDGKSIQGVIDTSASRSHMNFESAQELFGWNDKTTELKVTDRRKDGSPSKYEYPFHQLTFIGVGILNPDIVLKSVETPGEHRIGAPPPILDLGMDVLRQLHIYIAYREKNLYFTSADTR
jgi:predicted aspartyl protease